MSARVQPVVSLDSLVRSIVREQIAEVLAIATLGLPYSTERADLYPPGKKKRRPARDAIRAVPGHTRTGEGKATVWSVARAAYHAHHTCVARTLRIVPAQAADDDAIAEAAIAAAGVRPTRRSA